MSEFRVKAGWPDGSVAEQSVMAADLGAARLEVERRGGHVFAIRRKGFSLASGKARGKGGRIKMADFLIFNQELIALLKAGLPVVRSFEILLERQKSPVLRRVLTDVRERVNSGSSISEAFAEEGDLFPRLYWTSLKAGEKSGEIEAVLRRYLKYQKTVIALTRKVVSTLVYPVILIALSGVLIAILMTFVIPRFTEFFADFNAELPLLTASSSASRPSCGQRADPRRRVRRRRGSSPGGGSTTRGPRLARRCDADGPVRRRDLAAVRDHPVHAQPRDAARGRPAARERARGGGRLDRQPPAGAGRGRRHRVREGASLWTALDSTGILRRCRSRWSRSASRPARSATCSRDRRVLRRGARPALARVLSLVEPVLLVMMGGVVVAMLLSFYLPMFRPSRRSGSRRSSDRQRQDLSDRRPPGRSPRRRRRPRRALAERWARVRRRRLLRARPGALQLHPGGADVPLRLPAREPHRPRDADRLADPTDVVRSTS